MPSSFSSMSITVVPRTKPARGKVRPEHPATPSSVGTAIQGSRTRPVSTIAIRLRLWIGKNQRQLFFRLDNLIGFHASDPHSIGSRWPQQPPKRPPNSAPDRRGQHQPEQRSDAESRARHLCLDQQKVHDCRLLMAHEAACNGSGHHRPPGDSHRRSQGAAARSRGDKQAGGPPSSSTCRLARPWRVLNPFVDDRSEAT